MAKAVLGAAAVLGVAALIATAMLIYFSPYHSCVRTMRAQPPEAAAYCAAAIGGGVKQ